jgi:hypothetical protein
VKSFESKNNMVKKLVNKNYIIDALLAIFKLCIHSNDHPFIIEANGYDVKICQMGRKYL